MGTKKLRILFFFFLIIVNYLESQLVPGISIDKFENVTESQKRVNAANQAYEEYQGYVSEVYANLEKEISKDLGFFFNGTSGMMHLKIEELGAKFTAHRRATVDEARALQLYIMYRLVDIVNTHEKIQPYLEVRPFTYERVAIGISFRGEKGQNSDGSVKYISNVSGQGRIKNRNCLFYHSEDSFTNNLITILKENYREALKLFSTANLKLPFTHVDTPEEKAIDRVFRNFLLTSTNPWIECWAIGEKKDKNEIIDNVGLNFKIFGPHNQEEARKKAVRLAENLLSELNESEAIRPYLKEYPFPSNRLKMKIEFCDSRRCNYYDGSVDHLILNNDKIDYYIQKALHKIEGTPHTSWQFEEHIFATDSYAEALEKTKEAAKRSYFLDKVKSCYEYLSGKGNK